MTEQFTLGERVWFTKPLQRRMREEHPNTYNTGWLKVWEPVPHHGTDSEPVREGIVVGVRWLANGKNRYSGYDEPIVFEPRERFRAVLVATNLRRRAVFVLPENVKSVSEPQSSGRGES